MLNSLDFANFYNEAFENAGRADFFDSATIARIKDYQAGRITTQTIKSPNSNSWQSWNSANANNDWFQIYFKKLAFSQQHNVGISGGNDNTTYYVGLGYNDREGMYNYGNDFFKRFNIRANLSTNVTQWMTFNFRSTFSRSLYNTPNTYPGQTGGNYMHQIARKFPTVALYNPDGNFSDASNVPLHLYGGRNQSTEDQPVLTGEFVIRPLKDWTITANYTFDGDFYDYSSNQKTVYNFLPDGTTAVTSGTTPNSFSRSNYRNEHQVFNAFSSYKKEIGQHSFNILGGFTSELTSFAGYSVGNSQLYSNDIPSLNLSYGTSPSIYDQMRELAVAGYFGRLNYSFADKYLLEFDGRYDATSRFLPGKRWKFSPGVSAGWNVDKENFWTSIRNTINTFKIRGSYGSSPDQLFLGYPSNTSYSNYSAWYPFYPGLGITSPTNTSWLFGGAQQAAISQPPLVNSNLTWVTTTSYGIGADFSMLKNRLSLSYDYYIRKADNFAGPSQVLPSLLGTSVPSINNAGMKTTGFEVTAQWKDRIGDWGYSARVSLSDYTGTVTQYNNPTRSLSTWYVGQKMGEIWGYTTDGLYRSADEAAKAPKAAFWGSTWNAGDVKYKDLNGDGIINTGLNTADSSGDRRIIGNSTPRYLFSTLLTADYKGFDLSIFLQGVLKRDAWIGSNYFWGITGDEWQSSPFQANMNRWTANNPNGYFPKYYMSSQNNKNTQVSDRYLQNAAYLRIKSIQLGYTLPTGLLSKAKIQKMRVYFTAENVATFTKLIKNLDPELSINDGKIYPLQRTFSCGVNITL
jgi:TonB-linked SusC/RagA family outer membrane protein